MSNIKETLEYLLEARRESIYNMYIENLKANRQLVIEMLEIPFKMVTDSITQDDEPNQYTGKRYWSSKKYANSYNYREDTREELEEILISRLYTVEGVVDFIKKTPEVNSLPYFRNDWNSRSRMKIMLLSASMNKKEGSYHRVIASDDHLEMVAKQLTEDVIASFVGKMSRKLAAIGTVVESKIDSQWGNLYQTCLYLKFDNGIACNLINSIVGKISSKGNYFVQFPARFNNVTLNGETQKNCASEAAIKKLAKEMMV